MNHSLETSSPASRWASPRRLACVLAAGFVMGPVVADAVIDGTHEAVTRLTMQGQIDTLAPFSKTLWAGAHNAYAAYQWDDGTYTDVNQWYAPSKLFDRGIRVVEYDVYPENYEVSDPMLCHNSTEEEAICGSTFASFGDGLEEIRDYIEDHRDEVIFLKLETYNSPDHWNFHNRMGLKIEDKIEDMVFRPSDWGYGDAECASLPVGSLTKQDVLDAGRNVVIMTQTPRNYPYDGHLDLCEYHTAQASEHFLRRVWVGVDEQYYDGSLLQSEPLAQNGTQFTARPDGPNGGGSDASTHYENGNFSVKVDATTEYPAEWEYNHGDPGEVVKVAGAEILEAAEAGYNLIELALVEAEGSDIDIGNENGVLIEDYVWSWETNFPADKGSCAFSHTSGLLRDKDCAKSLAYVCVDEDRNWTIPTDTAGDPIEGAWSGGAAACEAIGLEFGMPYNARENVGLIAEKSNVAVAKAWLNYYEVLPDFWMASPSDAVLDNGYKKVSALGDLAAGNSFDDEHVLRRKFLTDNRLALSWVWLRKGTSGMLHSVEFCYTQVQGVSPVGGDSFCVAHGNSDTGDFQFLNIDYADGEFVDRAKVCIDEYQGDDRVVYLELETNHGQSVSLGVEQGASCSWKGLQNSDQLFALYGRADSQLVYQLGFHRVDASTVELPLTATSWLNRDGPASGTRDEERFSSHQNSGNISATCTQDDVAGVEVRVADTKLDWSLTGQEVVFSDDGFYCVNSDNGSDGCEDYEVRYFFTEPSCLP